MKQFSRTKEDFVCDNCGEEVRGDGYTNHCPHCLWSKHVDVNPGDRAEECRGAMKPIGIEGQGTRIVHRCIRCRAEKRVKVGKEDNFDQILEVAKSQ